MHQSALECRRCPTTSRRCWRWYDEGLSHRLDNTLNQPCSMSSSSGPDPGWSGCPPRLRPLPLRRAGVINPGPPLEGGLEELRELRPIRSRSWASSIARAASWLRSCSISCYWTRMNSLASGGHNSQSASGIPAGGVLITGGLCL